MRRSAIFLIGLLILATPLQGASQSNSSGRQSLSVGDACDGKSFEWLFVYTHAVFTIDIGTKDDQTGDWAWSEEANAFAEAWVNDSLSPVLRGDVDELVGGFTVLSGDPDANDSYLGTDEIEFLTGAGPECLSRVETRVAVTPSWSDGEDWNNITWVQPTTSNPDTIVVIEDNGVPAGPDGNYSTGDDPAELKACDSPSKSNCWEYPANIVGEDVYLNMTGQMQWRGLNDPSSFTILLNGTPNATYVIHIPPIPNLEDNESLELVYWMVHDPITGFADAAAPVTTVLDDGRTRVTIEMVPGVWELRFDTGSEVTWSDDAPADTTLFHANAGDELTLVAGEHTSSWFAGSINMLNAQCTAPSDWSATLDLEDGFRVTVPASASEPVAITCSASETSGERTWLVGPIFTASVEGDSIAIVGNAPEGRVWDLQYALGSSTERKTSWKFVSGPIDTTGIGRGTHSIWFWVLGPEDALVSSSSFISDLTYTVANKPPTVEQVTAAWDSKTVTLTIQINDPEGGEVTVKPYVGDTPYTAKRGTSVIGLDMDLSDLVLESNVTVRLEICDDENTCITHEQVIDASHLAAIAAESGFVTTEDVNKVLEDSADDGIPAPGLAVILMGFAGALLAVRRRERSERD